MDPERLGLGQVQEPLDVILELKNNPLSITTQVSKTGGVSKLRTFEYGEKTAVYRNKAIVGGNLVASCKNYVLIWILDRETAVMFATDNLDEVKPLHELNIESIEIPEELIGEDVSPNSGDIPLIYIGRIGGDGTIPQKLKEKAQVKNFTHFHPGSSDDWRFTSWTVAFDGKQSEISIFPQSGDICLDYRLGSGAHEITTQTFYKKYARFYQEGGVIGLALMREASTLNRDEMKEKHPRTRFYIADPQEQIDYIQKKTEIILTPEQELLYYNLRWIPSYLHQVIYDVGFTPPISRHIEKKTVYVHPALLDEIGLLSQVFKFTGDIERESLLRDYCVRNRFYIN